jgi:hypothetical protein
MVSNLSERALRDGEEAVQVREEHDKLRRWDAKATNRSSTSKASLRRRRG